MVTTRLTFAVYDEFDLINMQWAYGITCWEIFSGGRVPYSEIAIREVPKQLTRGYRLERPMNEACSDEM